jgi:16S rRNA (uracil1498-N3)-methyltransferase
MERQDRFFVEDLSAEVVSLPPGEAHHALNVMRLGAGAEVELFDGRGGLADGRIVEAKRGRVAVAVQTRSSLGPRLGPAVHLAFAVPKGKRLDWLLEKAAELGAASLRPIVFERSVAGSPAGKLPAATRERWLSHCIAAAKQSGLNWLPAIEDPAELGDMLTAGLLGAEGYFGIVGVLDGGARPLREVLSRCPHGRDVCLLVGPEGGMTHKEITDSVSTGFVPARLGRTILRVETAAIALLAATTAIAEHE